MTAAIGTLIRSARRQLGYSQYRLADALVEISGNNAITREQVARWERGKRIPGPYWRQWLTAALDVARSVVDEAARYARTVRAAFRIAATWLPLLAKRRTQQAPVFARHTPAGPKREVPGRHTFGPRIVAQPSSAPMRPVEVLARQ